MFTGFAQPKVFVQPRLSSRELEIYESLPAFAGSDTDDNEHGREESLPALLGSEVAHDGSHEHSVCMKLSSNSPLRDATEEGDGLALEVPQTFQLPDHLLVEDIFAGSELAEKEYDGVSRGSNCAAGRSDALRKSFTFIVCVKPDFSWDGLPNPVGLGGLPLLFCSSEAFHRDTFLSLDINGRKPCMSMGNRWMEASQELPDNEWTWLTYVYDSQAGKRLLINGEVEITNDDCTPFAGHGLVQVGHWEIVGSTTHWGFKGSLAGVACFEKALSNKEIRELLKGWGFQMPRLKRIKARMASSIAALPFERYSNAMAGFISLAQSSKLTIFTRRISSLADVMTDIILVADNATCWRHSWLNVQLHKDCNTCWAAIGCGFIVAPFVVEYILLWRNGVATLTKSGWCCPMLIYGLLGLPGMVVLKLWQLFFHPFSEAGYTQLSFMGAFDELDFVVEAIMESPWQALFALYMFYSKVLTSDHHVSFPTSITTSILASLWALKEAYGKVRDRQSSANHWFRKQKREELTLFGAVGYIFQAGMGFVFFEYQKQLGGAAAMEELCHALAPPSVLREVSLERCGIQDITPLADVLKSNSTLLELSLYDNEISDVSALADALKVNVTLKILRLSYNKITDVDVHVLLDAVQDNTSLQELALFENLLSSDMKEAIRGIKRDGLRISI